ncbi:uncharacterized protein LOC116614630 isoform X1 [Nematostella vectensis]|uniref:uncharacterized protein LOC116614630 isoform X1 n=1 Tax=Nematostella vectensis TaxID=45351 RepID=UPI002077750D|nr:uncharacterized protein LOC116614630 isoform X1 [Nematostella vectensis]
MADASGSNAGPGKKRKRPAKLPPMDELVQKAKQSFATKPKKESHSVCGWNPYTKKKSNKNTYNAGRQNRRQKKAKDDCTDILSRARELLRNWEGQSRHRPSWSERSITLQESWESLRFQLFNAKLGSFAVMPSQTCMLCINKMPSIQCPDCGPRTALCSECDISVHKSSPFHDRQALVQGHYVPIVPCLSWCTTSETWKNESKHESKSG